MVRYAKIRKEEWSPFHLRSVVVYSMCTWQRLRFVSSMEDPHSSFRSDEVRLLNRPSREKNEMPNRSEAVLKESPAHRESFLSNEKEEEFIRYSQSLHRIWKCPVVLDRTLSRRPCCCSPWRQPRRRSLRRVLVENGGGVKERFHIAAS